MLEDLDDAPLFGSRLRRLEMGMRGSSPAKLVSAWGLGRERRGWALIEGEVREIHLGSVPDAKPGDYLAVKRGSAVARLDDLEAEQVLALLEAGRATAADGNDRPGD